MWRAGEDEQAKPICGKTHDPCRQICQNFSHFSRARIAYFRSLKIYFATARVRRHRICNDMRIFSYEPYSWMAYLHKYAAGTINLWLWNKEKSQDFVEKSQGFVKTSRRLVKIIQGFFSTRPWFLSTIPDFDASKSLFSTSTFVKIFRIFYLMKKGLKKADEIAFIRTISSARELSI